MSVTSADSIATSVPVPIAIADVGRRERGRVVDAVADHRDDLALGLEGLDRGGLVVGRTSASTRSMPTGRAIASAVRRLSPVSIATASPSRCSSATASAEPGLERVGDGDDARRPGRRSRRSTGVLPSAASASAGPTSAATSMPRPRGTRAARRGPRGRRPSPRCPGRATPRKSVASATREPARLGGLAHDRVGERMLGAALGGGDEARGARPRRARRRRGRRR